MKLAQLIRKSSFVAFFVIVFGRANAQTIDFVKDIRPILSENCFFCHGPDAAQRSADLRLDTEEGIREAIDASDPEASELLRRILSDDEEEVMPPSDSNRVLSEQQKELVSRWIAKGAPTAKHWSFRNLEQPTPPDLESKPRTPIRNPIDSFVQAKLQDKGLHSNEQAHAATLLRRLSLDLTGLPPDLKLVQQVASQEVTYEELVERFLSSPEFGVRMAWDWLDAARYADTNGYQGDRERTMWPWRDWVIEAYNRNMPFDEFTVWQLAGDLLENATDEQKLATAFCRNHMINGEGGRIAEENRIEYVFDMAETTGTVWLGLTLNCCRCHDHKYDPISNEDYYKFFAFFNQTPVTGQGGDPQTPPNMPVPSQQQRMRLDEIREQLAEVRSKKGVLETSLLKNQSEWEASQKSQLENSSWHVLSVLNATAEHQNLAAQADGSILANGANPTNDTYIVDASTDLKNVTALQLEALQHKEFGNSLSQASSGNFVLTDLRLEVQKDGSTEFSVVPFASAKATFEQNNHAIANAFDSDPKSGWAVYEGKRVDKSHAAMFVLDTPLKLEPNAKLRVRLSHNSPHANHNLGRFRIQLSDKPDPALEQSDSELRAALALPEAERSKEQTQLIRRRYLEQDVDFARLAKIEKDIDGQRSRLENSLPRVMIMQDMDKPRETSILERGLYNKPTQPVQAGTPSFLPDSLAQNRLELAEWMVAPENPLTARVAVNRIWQMFFGTGLVKTSEDFGAQGEIPEHMELLDWLACEFRDSGWNVKELVRLIVTSHTYRQSSKILSKEQQELDPANRLYSRASRFRLPSWMIRDQALAASGLLSDVRSGPATNTYQPPGVWEEATFGKKKYKQGQGDELYRRSLFVYWRRIIAPTMFFDTSKRQTCTVKNVRTNTPLQALLTLNETTYVESARAMAQRVLLDAGLADDQAKLEDVFKRLLARGPSDREASVLLRGLSRARLEFANDKQAAEGLVSVGDSAAPADLDLIELASWTSLNLAVLNLDETLTRE